jgi:peptidyl-prolyl cis-trans isomerase D
MITALRSMLKSHAHRVFIWIFLVVIVFGGLSLDYSDNKPWIIKVFQHKITELEYRQAVNAQQKQLDYLQSQGISWPRTESVEKEILRHMIGNALVKNVGTDLEISVPADLLQEHLASQLQSLPAYFFHESGALNIEMLERAIAPMQFDEFLANIESEIVVHVLYDLASIGSYVADFEVAMQLTEDYASKKYSVATFPLQKALIKAKEHPVSDDVLQKFYKKSDHGDAYKSAEKRAGTYWKFSAKDYGLSVSQEDISAYYDKHKAVNYLESAAQVKVYRIFFNQDEADTAFDARKQAQIVHEELLQDPTTFAAVAKKIAGAKIKSQGSEKTDFFAKDSKEYDKIFIDTAFEQLSEDGQVSEIIKTSKGYEILQRIARKSAQYKSLASVEKDIQEKLLEEKFVKRFKQDAERIVSNIKDNAQGFDNFVEKRHGKKEVLDLDVRKPGVIALQLFQAEENGYVVFMQGKEGIVLHCNQIVKKALKPFDEIKMTVTADYYRKQAQELLATMASDALKQAASKDLEAIAKEYGAHLETAEYGYKNEVLEQSDILKRHEISSKIKVLQTPGAMITIVNPTESYLVRLEEIVSVDENFASAKKEFIAQALASKTKYQGRDSFIASLYRHAKLNNKIEVKDQLLKNTKDTTL